MLHRAPPAPEPLPIRTAPGPVAPSPAPARPPLHVAAVWGPSLIVLGLVLAVLAARARQQSAARWVAHTRDVLAAAQATLGHVQDAETGQRGYLLTGAPVYRAPYEAARVALRGDTAQLRALTRDNPAQQRRLDALTPQIAAKLAELDTTVRLRAAGDEAAALAVVRTDRGQHLMEDIRGALAAVTADEDALLAERRRREEWADAALALVVVAGGLATGLLAAVANGLLAGATRDAARAAQSEAARAELLAVTHARLQHERATLQVANSDLEAQATALRAQIARLDARPAAAA